MSRTTQTPRPCEPDATGLALAGFVQEMVYPDTVILFGSRARGDHRPDSDADLLIVCQTENGTARPRAQSAIRSYFRKHSPRLRVDVVVITRERFNYCLRAQNHVAAQALRDGVIMSGERLNYSSNSDDGYPDSWPDVKERLKATYRQLNTFNRMMEDGNFAQEDYGFHAQRAVENSMKAWMSAAEIRYGRIHDLEELAEALLEHPVEKNTLAGTQLQLLMDYTRFGEPDEEAGSHNWLTLYAVAYSYGGTGFRMNGLEQNRFRAEINLAVNTYINRAYELTGTSETDLDQ